MKILSAVALAILIQSQTLSAQPIVDEAPPTVKLPAEWKVNGDTYKNPMYSKHDACYLYILHDEGPARIRIADLPTPIKEALGYDARLDFEQSVAEKERLAALEKERLARLRAESERQIPLHARFIKNTPKGMLVAGAIPTGRVKDVSSFSHSRDGSSSVYVHTKEDEYDEIYFLVWGHPNAETIQENTDLHMKVTLEGKDYIEGTPALKAKYIGRLE